MRRTVDNLLLLRICMVTGDDQHSQSGMMALCHYIKAINSKCVCDESRYEANQGPQYTVSTCTNTTASVYYDLVTYL